jgi:hypothetical protein
MDRYDVRETIAETPLGRLVRAWDAEHRREVFLKTLVSPPGLSADDREIMRRRFVERARQLMDIQHAAFCRVLEVGEEAEEPYAVMVAARGRPLREALDRGDRFGEREAIDIVAVTTDVAAALVEHTDLPPSPSPDFIFVTDEGQVYVADGDFAVPPADQRLWEAGIAPGELTLLSPERLEGEPPSEASFVFAAGALLHRLATGRWPYHGTTPFAMGRSIERGLPELPSPGGLPLSRPLRRVIERSLSAQSSDRFETTRAFRDALLSAVPPMPAPEPEAPGPESPAPRSPGLPAGMAEAQAHPAPPPESRRPTARRGGSAWPQRIAVIVGIIAIIAALAAVIAGVTGVFAPPEVSPIAALATRGHPAEAPAARPAPPQTLQSTESPPLPRQVSPAAQPRRGPVPQLSRVPSPPAQPAPPGLQAADFGSLDVQCWPPDAVARVYVDGVYAGVAPHVIQRVPPGKRTVTLVAPGYRSWGKSVQVNVGDYVTVMARLTPN